MLLRPVGSRIRRVVSESQEGDSQSDVGTRSPVEHRDSGGRPWAASESGMLWSLVCPSSLVPQRLLGAVRPSPNASWLLVCACVCVSFTQIVAGSGFF